MYISKSQAIKLGHYFNINFDIIPFDEWVHGLNVELEHGNHGLKNTAKIAIVHLIEDPRYYYFLKKQEDAREHYWKSRVKPSIFN